MTPLSSLYRYGLRLKKFKLLAQGQVVNQGLSPDLLILIPLRIHWPLLASPSLGDSNSCCLKDTYSWPGAIPYTLPLVALLNPSQICEI